MVSGVTYISPLSAASPRHTHFPFDEIPGISDAPGLSVGFAGAEDGDISKKFLLLDLRNRSRSHSALPRGDAEDPELVCNTMVDGECKEPPAAANPACRALKGFGLPVVVGRQAGQAREAGEH